MAVCNGRGDRDGGHCCWINGQVCVLLEVNPAGIPRCTVWGNQQGNPVWQQAPIGQWFAQHHPGFDCADWPQNLPEVMANGNGLCCWQGV